ncbi:glycogen operon protein GlgX homolog [Flavimobilis marinus]|uniref:Glycogen operon protein n=1 Tax=Flavimobilis marinus TaxID=285351 RepID=A0A1I2HN89_9MICO|nr:glycogen debranching protein GlgX [Flavimobilis marinus]GHG56910.1 glycogen operon protein GlgX homolog [Flavimobilis marinus]SFF30760.1 glycogen operon protein [Flavimobilis marinus]
MTTSLRDELLTVPTARLGVHVADNGVTVAVLASHATQVELCLVDPTPTGWAERRVALEGPVLGVWRAHVPGVQPGQRYGFRVDGPWDPRAGLRYNPAKLLVDPYARGIEGDLEYGAEAFGYLTDATGAGDPYGPRSPHDSLGHVPLSVVVGPGFTPRTADRPRVPWSDTVLYEAHVRGLTMNLPDVPAELRGTYAGVAHPATIAHLRALGVTTIELLPVHASTNEHHLVDKGLTNYWGYNTIGFFAPEPRYAMASSRAAGAGAVLDEVKGMVQLLHEAGIEVVLDVVYNHTCEGGTGGPQVSWRGLDPTVYYRHDGGSPAQFADVTGCGNTLDFRRTPVVRMALDSLRFWASEVGVDGFRFDLAVTLGRGHDGYTADHPFLVALQTDPVLSELKLIAEPWDVGPGGWQTGRFPAPFAEWNDRFRNAVRSFWLTDAAEASRGRATHGVRELATRLSGSADLFGYGDPPGLRGPAASINFVTAHDGFTMADLTAYDHKHNEANGEDGRDGSNDNRSWNHGYEGHADAEVVGSEIAALRRRSHRNLLATLLLSAGTPMITAGDETGRSQHGNNNAYCQDNALSYLDWDLDADARNLLATTSYLLTQRRALSALRAERFFHGRPHPGGAEDELDLAWFTIAGTPFSDADWHDTSHRAIQMLRRSDGPEDPAVLLAVNGALDALEVTPAAGLRWELLWDSTWEHPDERFAAGDDAPATMEPLSVRLYASVPG